MPRIVSVWLPQWPVHRWLAAEQRKIGAAEQREIRAAERHRPSGGAPVDQTIDLRAPFVLADGTDAPRITALNHAAHAAGLVVGETLADVRRVMIEGPSGLRAVAKTGRTPRYVMGRGEVRWPNGAIAYVYSADAPEQLRGPEHSAAWCDELAKWRRGDAA